MALNAVRGAMLYGPTNIRVVPRPIPVEAVRFVEGVNEPRCVCRGCEIMAPGDNHPHIHANHSTIPLENGDWIIMGKERQVLPPDEFARLYMLAE